MSKDWKFKSGDWNLNCDVCGKKIKASESKLRWDGFRVCVKDWEPRHSMDFIRARADKISVPFTRPQQEPVFVEITYVSQYVASNYVEDYNGYITDPSL